MKRCLISSVALVLLCASAAHAARFGANEVLEDGATGRDLLQRELDCTKILGCSTCRYQRKPGSRTSELVCSTCKTGYRLRRDGISKTCDCAPGFYMSSPGTCVACTKGAYCPGYDKTKNADNSALSCSPGLETTFAGAKSIAQCFTVAGNGRQTSRALDGSVTFSAVTCNTGSYNVGGNTADCQKCPAGTTTMSQGSVSPTNCGAPAGSYLDKGIGKLCPKGTYSTAFNFDSSCTACPTGITTASEGSSTPNACQFAVRGYYMVNATAAAPCPVNTYNDGETLKVNDTCFPCPNEMKTKLEGADGEALCLAPPGWELVDPAANITECPAGSYKVDWNRNRCVQCGTNLGTLNTGSMTKDACLVPPGYGLVASGEMAAEMCGQNFYGMPEARPVSAASRCVACPANTITADSSAHTDQTACQVIAGYGLAAGGIAEICPNGTYNGGGNREVCKSCPAGYTTMTEGNDALSDCVIRPGWELRTSDNKPHPCDIGSYSKGGVNVTCTPCPSGYTTQTDESESEEDCNVCDAGFGGSICSPCPTNTYAYAGAKPSVGCVSCAAGSVSAGGSTEAGQCYSEFIDPEKDVFSVTETAWTNGTAVDAVSCQTECKDSSTPCITYRFGANATTHCQLLLETAGSAQIGFKIGSGVANVVYAADSSWVFGVPLGTASGASTIQACAAACKARNDCEAFVLSGGVCSLKASELDESYQGMVHVDGAHIQ